MFGLDNQHKLAWSWLALFAYKPNLDITRARGLIENITWLFAETVVEFNNVMAWKTAKDGDNPKLRSSSQVNFGATMKVGNARACTDTTADTNGHNF